MMDYAARAASANTLPKLLRLNAREHATEIAFREKDLGVWREFTWGDYQARVGDFALGLVEIGVGKGDVVALVGTTGRTTAPHLHYEVRVNNAPVNPWRYMRATPAGD